MKVWDATTGQETLTLKGHQNAVMGVAFSPDGRELASSSVKRSRSDARGQSTPRRSISTDPVLSKITIGTDNRLHTFSSFNGSESRHDYLAKH